ncbi:MAG: dehydrogenase [Planctomycetes bacterium]|nr:dehydrogenase [Planctomycetota bacterium]
MASADEALAYWVEAPGRGALRPTPLPPPGESDVALIAEFSGVSIGTERLVGRGLVPERCAGDMACAGMQGSFALPVCYGYSLVGRIASGPLAGRRGFAMHPHQERAVVARNRVVVLPDAVPSARATLFPNLETAVNGVWDAEPRRQDRAVVVGAGAVGLLIAFVFAKTYGEPLHVVEADPERRRFAVRLPWIRGALAPHEVEHDSYSIAFHTTATSSGLQVAIDALGFEGQVVDLSWYGKDTVTLDLGTTFHHRRKRLLASQVAAVAPLHREAGRSSRTEVVLEFLHDAALDMLHGAPVPFAKLPALFSRIYRGETIDPCPVVAYPAV